MRATSSEQGGLEPTIFRAVRRCWPMVVVAALLGACSAVAYTVVEPDAYRANATVSLPQTSLAQGESNDQYLDSQVLMLQSQEVADRATRIANGVLNGNVLSPQDFSAESKSLKVTPPEAASSGGYGASIASVSFTWPDARVAQVATNAVLQAFDDVRISAITAQGTATVARIDKAISNAKIRGQLTELTNQRTRTLVNEQVDLARHPTVNWAVEPRVPISPNSRTSGSIGLLIGLLVGAGLAYARVVRNPCIEDRLDPATIYEAPLIGEIPAPSRGTAGAHPLPMAADPQSPLAEAFRFAAGSVERIRAARGTGLVVAFVSTNTGPARSSVLANLALALAEGSVPVLAVDADSTGAGLTALLLPDSPRADGVEQVLSGQRSMSDCLQPSRFNQNLTVLAAGPSEAVRTTGSAYSRAIEELIGKAKASFDLVLIDSPALLRVADASELVNISDAAIIVACPNEPVRDHISTVQRLDLVESNVVGYIYRGVRRESWLKRVLSNRRSARIPRREALPVVPSWS